MTIDEISEDLQSQFGKPHNQTEDNICYVLTLVAEHVEGDHVNEDVSKPSLDALATTCYAMMTYGTIPWEELCKKPAIKRTLTWIVIRGKDHYDEVEDAIRQLMHKNLKGLNLKMIQGFMKLTRALSNEEHPSRLIEYVINPAHYDDIVNGLHTLIHYGQDEHAALYITCAIEDGIIAANVSKPLLIDEFNLNKSGFYKYFGLYYDDPSKLEGKKANPANHNYIENRKKSYKTSLRSAIGYTVKKKDDDQIEVTFRHKALKRRNILTVIIAYLRSIF